MALMRERRLGASQRLSDGLMSSQLLTHQRQWQRQVTTFPWDNGADELNDPDGMTFEGTPMIRPTDSLVEPVPRDRCLAGLPAWPSDEGSASSKAMASSNWRLWASAAESSP